MWITTLSGNSPKNEKKVRRDSIKGIYFQRRDAANGILQFLRAVQVHVGRSILTTVRRYPITMM
jgi:hypothetical protein